MRAGVSLVVNDPGLGGVSGLGNSGLFDGLDELNALFYAEDGEDTARHDLVYGGKVGEASVHGVLHETDDGSTVVCFLSDYGLEFWV